MKYTITIQDVCAAELVQICQMLTNEVTVKSNAEVIPIVRGVFNPPAREPINAAANAAAVQMLEAARVTPEDADSIMNAPTSELLKSASTIGETDSEGLPWDGRIHSGSKKKNADGKWKLLKNVDEALVASVKHSYKSTISSNLAANVPPFLANVAGASASVPQTVPATFGVNVAVPQPETVISPVSLTAMKPARDFSGLMMQISKLFATKSITPDYPITIVNRVNAGFNVKIATLTDVANDPRMVEYSWQCLDVDGKAS
jgi:hypothetical protein